jgi:GT2 family glycosyltransferase
MDLSIIIVNWNTKDLLTQCIKSIISDTTQFDTEIIVVDNASHDGSQEAIRNIFPFVNLICNESNLGFAKANNIGLKISKGDYICLINTDVEILPGCIGAMMKYIKKNTKIGLLGPETFEGDRKTIQMNFKKEETLLRALARTIWLDNLFPNIGLYTKNITQQVDVISGCFWMVGRKAFKEVGYLDESFFFYGEDKDWCKRFKKLKWEIVHYTGAKIIHYGNKSSSIAPYKYHLLLEKAYLQYWKKYHGTISYMFFYFLRIIFQLLRLISYSLLVLITLNSGNKNKYKMLRSFYCLCWLFRISIIRI